MSFNRMTYFGDDLSGVSLGVYDNKATVSALDKNNSGFSKLSINSNNIDISGNEKIKISVRDNVRMEFTHDTTYIKSDIDIDDYIFHKSDGNTLIGFPE